MAEESVSYQDRVIDYLNQAAFLTSDKEKLEILCKIQEIVIHCDKTLLDSFFEDVVVFQNDKSANIRKFVVGFIEEACKHDHAMLPRLVPNICILVQDESMAVIKRVVQAISQLHKSTLRWISSLAHNTTKEMEQTWDIICSVKNKILKMIDHDNDGVRTQAIKFLESLILTQTYSEPDSIERQGELCLSNISSSIVFADHKTLEHDAKNVIEKLITFQGSLHISSVNLMTCMSSLTMIARARPIFMQQVIEALEILHANLPPTLTKSQVNSVQKQLKIQLLNLLRHVAAYDFKDNIITILNDLNVTSAEINKALPQKDDLRRRMKRLKVQDEKAPEFTRPKKIKMEKMDTRSYFKNSANADRSGDVFANNLPEAPPVEATALDVTQRWLVDTLNPDNVTSLVLVSMLNLPETLPSVFSATYKPISNAGSANQIQYLARMLASQMTAAQVGPGFEMSKKKDKEAATTMHSQDMDYSEDLSAISTTGLTAALGKRRRSILKETDRFEKPLMPAAMIARPVFQRMKFVKLSEVTKKFPDFKNKHMQLVLLKSILKVDKFRLYGISHRNRLKILAKFTALANYEELVELESSIFDDLNKNLDLLQSWIYTLYSTTQNLNNFLTIFEKSQDLDRENSEFRNYSSFMCHIIKKITRMSPNVERDNILSKIILDCPRIQNQFLEILLDCTNQGPETVDRLMELLYDVTQLRPTMSFPSMCVICTFASHENVEVRTVLKKYVEKIHGTEEGKDVLIEKCQNQLNFLVDTKPPPLLFTENLGRAEYTDEWTESTVLACLYLTLAVLPYEQNIIHILSHVYVKTVNEAKRTILRYLEGPVSHMGMDSPVLLSLVENCPKGSETLITRIIHILTEKAPPSDQLVRHVKELYNKRVSDVRFLIPVLTGLTKKEVVAVLPKLIKLNPQVVKEVFNRLWGVTLDKGKSALSPVDLMVALHLINPEKCDVKTIIKATGMCFAERNIYTAEVLALVLQQLMEEATLPTLFMRTVIQTLTHHPKILTFVINILQKLVIKQIWKNKKAWEGFIKCCERSMPQSFNVLLTLPQTQLAEVLSSSVPLHSQMLKHITELTDSQKEHISPGLLQIIHTPHSALVH